MKLKSKRAQSAPLPKTKVSTNDVLAVLGHEMRNPLSALSNALEVWEHAQCDAVQIDELRQLMKRQVSQLLRFSDDLLDAEKISQGRLPLRQEQVELRQLVNDACEEIRPFIDRCGHALTVTMGSESIAVQGDRSRLLQVFANLIQNAAKFTARQGSLRVSVEPQDGMAAVRVKDNGHGIDEQMLSTIFESNTQLNGTYGPENDGLGIGLRLVKTIVELHGGSVVARSAGPGQGSEFTVLLPLSNDGPVSAPTTTDPIASVSDNGAGSTTHRIVVVDDCRSNRELLARMLRMVGQSVMVASTGEMAIDMVLEERPEVVFLDLAMPGIDGCEVVRRLRSHRELEGLILIALSGSGDEHTKDKAIAAGFDAYLVKPTSVDELVTTLAGFGLKTRE